jgi:hypothetical protein
MFITCCSSFTIAQSLSNVVGIGSNMQLKPFKKVMGVDTLKGWIGISNLCKDHYSFDGLNVTPGYNEDGYEQATYDAVSKKHPSSQQFGLDLKGGEVGIENVNTFMFNFFRFYLFFNFAKDTKVRYDTLLISDPDPRFKDIGIAYFDDTKSNRVIYTKQSTSVAREQIISVAMDEQENMYILGEYGPPFFQMDSLQLKAITSADHQYYNNFKNFFLISLDKNGNMRWGKKLWVGEGSLRNLTYNKDYGLMLSIYDGTYIDSFVYDTKWYTHKKPIYPTLNNYLMFIDTNGSLYNYHITLNKKNSTTERSVILHAHIPHTASNYVISAYKDDIKVGNDSIICNKNSWGYKAKNFYVTRINKNNIEYAKALDFKMDYHKSNSLENAIQIEDLKADTAGNFYILGTFGDTLQIGNQVVVPYSKQDVFIAAFNSQAQLLWLQSGHGIKNDSTFASSMVLWKNQLSINGYLTDSFYWDNQYIDNQKYRHMFIARFETQHTGVEMLNLLDDMAALEVYPNPTQDILNIVMEHNGKTSIKLYDISGKEVIYIQTNKTYQTNIDISTLPSGMYYLKAEGDTWQAGKKIMKR